MSSMKMSEAIDFLGEGNEKHEPRFSQWPLQLAPLPSDMDAEVALVMIEEMSRPHKCAPACSCGGVPPGYPDQMPGLKTRRQMRERIDDQFA